MQVESGEYENVDQELEEALELLKSIPQSTVALRIGISERRLRDIERGLSRPRSRTREAILRFADSVRSDGELDRRVTAESSTDSEYAATDGVPNLLWSILIVTAFLGGLAALVYFASKDRPAVGGL